MIKSLDCKETLVARLVSEGRGGRRQQVYGRCKERGEERENFAKMLNILQLNRCLNEEAMKNGAGVGNARTGQ